MSDTDYEDNTDNDSSFNDDTTGSISSSTDDSNPSEAIPMAQPASDEDEQNASVVANAIQSQPDQTENDKSDKTDQGNINPDQQSFDHDLSWDQFKNWLHNSFDNWMDQPAGKISGAHAAAPKDTYQVPGARGPARLAPVAAPSAAEAAQPENPNVSPQPVRRVSPRGGQVGRPPPPQNTPLQQNPVSPAGAEAAQPQSPDMQPTPEMIQQGFLTPEQRAAIDRADPSTVNPGDPTFGLPGSNSRMPPGNPGQPIAVKGDPTAINQLEQLKKVYPPSQIANQWPSIVQKAGVRVVWDPVANRSMFEPVMTKTPPTPGPAPQYYGAPQPNPPKLPSNPATAPAPPAGGPAIGGVQQAVSQPQGPRQVSDADRAAIAGGSRDPDLLARAGITVGTNGQLVVAPGSGGTPQGTPPQRDPNAGLVHVMGGTGRSRQDYWVDPTTGQRVQPQSGLPGRQGTALDPDLQARLDRWPRDAKGNIPPGVQQAFARQQFTRDTQGATKGNVQTAAQRQKALHDMDANQRDEFLKTNPAFAKGTTFERLSKRGAAPAAVGPPLPGALRDPTTGQWVLPAQ